MFSVTLMDQENISSLLFAYFFFPPIFFERVRSISTLFFSAELIFAVMIDTSRSVSASVNWNWLDPAAILIKRGISLSFGVCSTVSASFVK